MDKDKLLKNARMVVLIISIVYITLTVLASISALNDIINMSTTSVNIGTIFSLVWFQLCIIVFLAFTYYLYSKKSEKGVVFEIIIAVALMLNTGLNMIVLNVVNSMVLLNYVIPGVMLTHSFIYIYRIYFQKNLKKTKEEFTLK